MQIERVTSAAQRVLDVRAEFNDFTLADLYETDALLQKMNVRTIAYGNQMV